MLSLNVLKICDKNSEHCGVCPLFATCSMPIEEFKGTTENEKTRFWERKMNLFAKKLCKEGV